MKQPKINIEIKNDIYAIVTASKGFKSQEFHFNRLETSEDNLNMAQTFKKIAEEEGLKKARKCIIFDKETFPGLMEAKNCKFI